MVDSVGGFVAVDFALTQLPSLVILGDGRVIQQGAMTLEFPGPALPPLMVRTLSEEGLQTVLEAFEESDLFVSDLELRGLQAMVADAPDTRFQLNAAGNQVTVQVYALDMLAPDQAPPPGVSAAELQAHEILSALNQRLIGIGDWVPADEWATDEWVPFEPQAFRLYVRDVTDQPADGVEPQPEVREWPTDDDPATVGEEQPIMGEGARCFVAEGEDAATWFAELTEARQNALWSHGDRRYSVTARPILPNEEPACPDVDGA